MSQNLEKPHEEPNITCKEKKIYMENVFIDITEQNMIMGILEKKQNRKIISKIKGKYF